MAMETAMSGRKGAKYERELLNLLDGEGFASIRIPASGAGTDKDRPDIIAGRAGRSLALEAKYRARDRVYLSSEEIEALCSFASKFGAEALVALRWKGDTSWYFCRPQDMERTGGGNYVGDRKIVTDIEAMVYYTIDEVSSWE